MCKNKILIVEDETIVALDIKSAVIQLGFSVTSTVTNYDDALKSVVEDEPHIILMDINLYNSKDGIETAKAIKKIKDIPVIYLTAFSDDKTIQRAIETEPAGYLTKPFKRDEVKSTIKLALYKLDLSNKANQVQSYTDLGSNYYYDLKYQNLFYKESSIKLSANEKKLLTTLIEAKGVTVPFSVLEHAIWANEAVSNSALRTLLYRLRSKFDYNIIETTTSYGCSIKLP
ncbi:MAG: response regulator [Campylobacterota bacterium]|nr:response regulator [Campylobacterota bacterium]